MCVKGGRGGQTMRRSSSLCARLVMTLSGCAVCAVTCWESSPGQQPDGSRLPGISWSCSLDAAQLRADGSDKHAPQRNCSTELLMWAVGPDPLCSVLPVGWVWSSALPGRQSKAKHSTVEAGP